MKTLPALIKIYKTGSTLSTLPSAETVRPGFLKSGRPSLRQDRVGGGMASLWQWSSTGPPSITVAFTSSPLMLGGTVADRRTSYRLYHQASSLKREPCVQTETLNEIHVCINDILLWPNWPRQLACSAIWILQSLPIWCSWTALWNQLNICVWY